MQRITLYQSMLVLQFKKSIELTYLIKYVRTEI